MSLSLKREEANILGFFLMEVIALVIIFITFSSVIVGWYSNFVSNKSDIIKRGRAIFIGSNILESIRMSGRLPSKIDYIEGFKTGVTSKSNTGYTKSAPSNFAEVTVKVAFSEKFEPVCLSTGILLKE